jgi:alpha-glucosidase
MARNEWWQGAVIYEICLRSFVDSGGDGIGDLPGAIRRLDYLNDGTPASLGVDAIWLTPFYPSPQSDFGYDVSDYQAVDPVFGALAEFDELVTQAHRRGIRVLIDLVMNHTSVEHPWFTAARSSRSSPHRDWYIWADPAPDGGPPNNWLSAFEASGTAWCYDEATGQYYLHSFTPGQADLNWRNPAVLAAMQTIWRFWLDRDVDGFRVDVAHRLMKDAQLRDNPAEIAHGRRHLSHPLLRQQHLDRPEVHAVLRELRLVLDSYGDRFALGEVPISDDLRLIEYFGGDGMHSAFHVAFWEQPWDGPAFRTAVDGLAGRMRAGALPTYALATHDISRTVTRYGSTRRARVAAMMSLTLRGNACLYYGEEIGMTDAQPPPGEVTDVDGRDGGRVPMQWDDTGAGFTTGTPWLPFGPDLAEVNVARQDDDPGSLLNLYRRLIWFRRGSEALGRGDYRSLETPPDTFAYLRSVPGERLLIALNFASSPASVTVPELPPAGEVEMSTRADRAGSSVNLRPLLLAPDEGMIVRLADSQ